MTTTATKTASGGKGGRKSASLPPETVEYLKTWMMSPEHVAHPYPTEQEKAQIMAETGIEMKQLTNWFVNNRKRYWKPRVEAKLQKYPPPAGAGGGVTHASLPGGGGLSISIHHMRPKAQVGTSFPLLPGGGVAPSHPPQPYPQSPQAQRSGPGPASPPPQHRADLVPAAAVAPAHASDARTLAHTISEGSGSSACNSDDDSLGASSGAAPDAGGAGSQARAPGGGGGYRRHEEVDVHVLRPERSSPHSADGGAEPLPTLRDLSIKSSVPKERILATFKCPISYTIPYDIEHDRKKVQSRRDGEVLRVKKHYLKLYLATRGIHSASSPVGKAGAPASSGSSSTAEPPVVASAGHAVTPNNTTLPAQTTSLPRSRSFICTNLDQGEDDAGPPPRKRARTESGTLLSGEDEWRDRCQHARSLFCKSLPGLEEAAKLFGYVSQ